MKISYDPDADAAYIEVKAETADHTLKIDDDTLLDVNKKEELVGVELLFVKKDRPELLQDLFGVLEFKKYTEMTIDEEKLLSLKWFKRILSKQKSIQEFRNLRKRVKEKLTVKDILSEIQIHRKKAALLS